MKMKMAKNQLKLVCTIIFLSVFFLSATSFAFPESEWGSITRKTIESRANTMMSKKWSPKSTIKNFGYRSVYHTFSKGNTYTGVAYSQNNPQESWGEFYELVKNTKGGTTGYGNDCSGFASIAWKLPKRYTTWTFENDATNKGGYVHSLGAVGSGSNAGLQSGDALNKSKSHIVLFKKRTSGGIITMEQTPWNAKSRTWSWAQLSKYRPIRRNKIIASSSSTTSNIIGTVKTKSGNLNVRSGPGTKYKVVGSLKKGAKVTIQCRVTGKKITGNGKTSTQWYRIGNSKYVSEVYMSASKSVPTCK